MNIVYKITAIFFRPQVLKLSRNPVSDRYLIFIIEHEASDGC